MLSNDGVNIEELGVGNVVQGLRVCLVGIRQVDVIQSFVQW